MMPPHSRGYGCKKQILCFSLCFRTFSSELGFFLDSKSVSFLWWRFVVSSVKIEFVASVVVLSVYHGKSPLVQNVIRKYSSSFVPTILSKSQMVHVPMIYQKVN